MTRLQGNRSRARAVLRADLTDPRASLGALIGPLTEFVLMRTLLAPLLGSATRNRRRARAPVVRRHSPMPDGPWTPRNVGAWLAEAADVLARLPAERARGFYIVDRTEEVGFKPGEDLNVERTIRLRRRIE